MGHLPGRGLWLRAPTSRSLKENQTPKAPHQNNPEETPSLGMWVLGRGLERGVM